MNIGKIDRIISKKEKARTIKNDLANPGKCVYYAKQIIDLNYELCFNDWKEILTAILKDENGRNVIKEDFDNIVKSISYSYYNLIYFYEQCIDYSELRKIILTKQGIETLCKYLDQNSGLNGILDKLFEKDETASEDFFINNIDYCLKDKIFLTRIGYIFSTLMKSKRGQEIANNNIEEFEFLAICWSYKAFICFFEFLHNVEESMNEDHSLKEYNKIVKMIEKYKLFTEMINQINSKEIMEFEKENTWKCFKNIFLNERTFNELSLIIQFLYDKCKSVQFVGEGATARVFKFGDKVLKIRYNYLNNAWLTYYHPKRMMMPDFRKKYEDSIELEVFDFADIDPRHMPENINSIIKEEMLKDGYHPMDLRIDNIGRLLKDNKLPSWLKKYPGVDLSILGLNVNPKKWTKEDLENSRKAGDNVITDVELVDTASDSEHDI